jgi:hypothetical protein
LTATSRSAPGARRVSTTRFSDPAPLDTGDALLCCARVRGDVVPGVPDVAGVVEIVIGCHDVPAGGSIGSASLGSRDDVVNDVATGGVGNGNARVA